MILINLTILNDFCSWWWLWWILPFFIGLALGWLLWSKWKKRAEMLEDEIIHVETEHKTMTQKLSEHEEKILERESTNALVRGQLREKDMALQLALSELTEFRNAEKELKSKYQKLEEVNLQIIEGIGPKMQDVLVSKGVTNVESLAANNETTLRNLLDEFGEKYKIIDPSDWPKQASFVVKKDWDGLIKYQKLDGSDSKAEKLMIKLGIRKQWKLDDLKAIEGIGPKIAELLRSKGVSTWEQLSKTEVNYIQTILNEAGGRYSLSDPSTWPKQALLASQGKFKELEEYQESLKGGKEQ